MAFCAQDREWDWSTWQSALTNCQDHKTGRLRGAGSRTLDELDTFIIIFLYMDEPSRGIPTYAAWLHNFSGTLVSKSVLRRFFKEAFLLELDFAIQT